MMSQPLQHQTAWNITSSNDPSRYGGAKPTRHQRTIHDPKSIESTLKMLREAKSHLRKIGFALNAAEGEIKALSGYYERIEQP